MIPHGYVTASDKTREPGREADQVLVRSALHGRGFSISSPQLRNLLPVDIRLLYN